MDELTAAPSSTEPSAEELASIAMGTNTQEAGMAAPGELTAAAPDAGAAPDLSAPSGSAATVPSMPSPDAADVGNVTAAPGSSNATSMENPSGSAPAGEAGNDGANAADLAPSTSAVGSPQPPLSPAAPDVGSDGGDAGNADASAAADPSIDAAGSAPPASPDAGTSSTDASSLGERLLALPHRVAQHLESIYELVTEHVRQTEAPAHVVKAELAVEIDDLLHKLSNGIAISDGRIVAKLAALRSLL